METTGVLALRPAPLVPGTRRLLALGVVGALLLLVLQGWAPRVLERGGEGPVQADVARPMEPPAPFDVDAAVAEASHALRPVPGRPAELQVDDPAYAATFAPDGFTYRPSGSSDALGLSLVTLERGGSPLTVAPEAWEADGNVASRSVHPEVRERVTARSGEIEWDLVLRAPPAGAGDLVARADLAGVTAPPRTVRGPDGPALRLGIVGGGSARVGEVVVIDASGVELHRALPTVVGEALQLVVPGGVLDGAAYPVTVDPTVSSGTPLDGGDGKGAEVAFDGSNYLVVWGQPGDDPQVHAARVSGDGRSVGGAFPVSTSTKPDSSPDVAWNGSTFLVVWTHTYSSTDLDIHARRVSTAGLATGDTFPVSSPSQNQSGPAVTAAGSAFYAVWTDRRNGDENVYGARVSGSGTVLDTSGTPLAGSVSRAPDVAWNGSTYLVTFEKVFSATDTDIYTRRVDAAGAALAQPQPLTSPTTRERDPAVASDGHGWLVAWTDGRNGDDDIFASRVNASGQRLDQFPVESFARAQSRPDVAFNGSYLVAWSDARRGVAFAGDVYAGRVTTGGAVLDGNGFLIANDFDPVVATGPGGRWGVVTERDVYGGDLTFYSVSPK